MLGILHVGIIRVNANAAKLSDILLGLTVSTSFSLKKN